MKVRMSCLLALCLALSCFTPASDTGAPTRVPESRLPLIDDFAYPNPAAAQAGWKPSEAAGTTFAPGLIEGRRVLRLSCAFKGAGLKRAAWDHKVKLDLTACRGVQLQLYCANTSAIAQFSLYLHSGNGWYVASAQASQRGWITVTIDKTRAEAEGRPAGWNAIDAIRVAAWRADNSNTAFYIANLGLFGADSPIVIVRARPSGRNQSAAAQRISGATQAMARTLDDLGLTYTVIDDREATPARLTGKKLVVLPYNPQLPTSLTQALTSFVQSGGRLISCYSALPTRLAQAVGIRTGRLIQRPRGRQFAAIRATTASLPGQPARLGQHPAGIVHAEPIGEKARVAALWFDERGRSTGEPAIVASSRAVHMTQLLQPDEPEGKRLLALAMLGHLAPEFCEEALQATLQAAGRFYPFNNLDEALKAMQAAAAGKPDARGALNEAVRVRQEIQQLITVRKYPEAMAKTGAAHAAALGAWSCLQGSQPGERRFWWCEDPCGVEGMTWDEAIKNLADHGFTAILARMNGGNGAYYASKVFPVAPEVRQRGDQLAQCLAACRKYGVECHVWKVAWNMGENTTPEFAERMKRAGRTQVQYNGTVNRFWLCPSNPANQQLLIDAMAEFAAQYRIDGIHFDFIRYPADEGCFCAGCREQFEKMVGHAVKNWPADTRKDAALKQPWLDFRRANITRLVAAVSELVRRQRPGVKISAAVFPDWTTARDSVGQDWKLWCERGYLDFVCPMNYTAHETLFESQVSQQLGWAGKVAVYPGIGLSVWDSRMDAAKLFEFINITRRQKSGGFAVYSYQPAAAREVVPLCGNGITRKE